MRSSFFDAWVSGIGKIILHVGLAFWYCRILHAGLTDFRWECFFYKCLGKLCLPEAFNAVPFKFLMIFCCDTSYKAPNKDRLEGAGGGRSRNTLCTPRLCKDRFLRFASQFRVTLIWKPESAAAPIVPNPRVSKHTFNMTQGGNLGSSSKLLRPFPMSHKHDV